ncbi:MAG: TonB-dependent receptor [Proteobacteria bacterium]|nr:TonB-dependent receptor [Pseudomonadota bacterium]
MLGFLPPSAVGLRFLLRNIMGLTSTQQILDQIGHRDDPLYGSGTFFNGVTPGNDIQINFHALTGTYDVSDELQLKAIVSWRDTDDHAAADLTGTGFRIFDGYNYDEHEQIYAEFQAVGTTLDGKLDYTTGFTYFEDDTYYWSQFIAFGNGLPRTDLYQDGEAYGAYSQLSYHIGDRLTLTAGLRYSNDEKKVDFPGLCGELGVGRDGQFVCVQSGFSDSVDFSAWTPMIRAEYQLTDDLLGYAGWSKGFQAGGYNQRAATDTDPGDLPYADETLFAWDAGIKSAWFDNRLQLNLAGYYYDFKEQQVQIPGLTANGSYQGIIRNVGRSRLRGIEVETRAIPLPGLDLRFSYSMNLSDVSSWPEVNPDFIDAEAASYRAECAIDPVPSDCFEDAAYRKRVHNSPKHMLTGSAIYTFEPQDWGRLSVSLSFSRRSRIYTGTNWDLRTPEGQGNRLVSSSHYTKWDARVQVDDLFGREGLCLAGVGENLGDRIYGVSGSAFLAGSFGLVRASSTLPRRGRHELRRGRLSSTSAGRPRASPPESHPCAGTFALVWIGACPPPAEARAGAFL